MSSVKNIVKKIKIPKALHDQVWLKHFGQKFSNKCYISWCQNKINVFNFECGHNKPESKGGETTLDNLYPICNKCNKSMSNTYTITEWNKLGKGTKTTSLFSCCCRSKK